MRKPIQSVEEFYAHALAIEREAAERYTEFESYFGDRGEDALAGLCRNLASLEREHLGQLLAASRHLRLPVIADDRYQWQDTGSPEAASRECFYRVRNPRQLLEVAFQAECAALAFFEWTTQTTRDPAVRSIAREMAAEEQKHVRWVRHAMDYRTASSAVDSDHVQ